MIEADEEVVYELCPYCDCDKDCAWCDGVGLVPHECDE